MKIVEPDHGREKRCGFPEVVYGGSKEASDLVEIAHKFISECGRVVLTKVSPEKARPLMDSFTDSKEINLGYSERAQVFVAKNKDFRVKQVGVVGLLTAGTSDIPIAEEARIVALELGLKVVHEYDVGVAGIHRLYPALDNMKRSGAFIVVAGMEGALPSVVSGLVSKPVIGVPTSVGYGTGKGGKAALYTMLNSCSPVAVVNIDNGFGAAVLAYQIVRN